jgi:alpha-amylase
MIGLITWVRSFTYDKDGAIIKNADGPAFAAHPQPNLWAFIAQNAKGFAAWFDLLQLAPWTEGSGEGYTPFCLRSLNSNWGTQAELIAAKKSTDAERLQLAADVVLRQMGGENGGAGVFKYANGIGNTLASWFSNFGQPGETTPPFVGPDDVLDPSGDYPFGRVRSYQHCLPAGATTEDSIDAMKFVYDYCDVPWSRIDDGKGTYLPFVRDLIAAFPGKNFYSEVDTGDPAELDSFVRQMNYKCAVEDYAQYWMTQRACNNYNARLFNPASPGGYWRWNSPMAIGFVNNPDVATSWSPSGGISQQIAFNLLLGYALNMFLPYRLFLIYAEDYFPTSPNYPTGRGLMTYLQNMAWVARNFAFGAFAERWVDNDVYCYTRSGDGGSVGQSGGLLVAVNFNTLDARTITVGTMWPDGTHLHNYSATGGNEYAYVGAGGMFTFTIKSNYFSGGQSYMLWARAQ